MRKLTVTIVTWGLASGLLAVPLWAQPVEEAHGASGGANPFAGDFGNVLWTLLVFLLLLFVLGKYAWGPILAGLQGREQYIRDSLEEARQNRLASEARLAEYETRLAGARDEVEAMISEARRDAQVLRQREEARAKEEAEKMLERARREIGIAKETAVQELYQQATRLSVAAASRILDREIGPQDHERLIAESIAALEPGGKPEVH